jgi:hypothetical protein
VTIVPGCEFGIAQPGSYPRQCAKTSVATIVVADDAGSRDPCDVCQTHYQWFADTLQGTLYTENASGTPAPKRVHLVSL